MEKSKLLNEIFDKELTESLKKYIKQDDNMIEEFKGEHRWLSNFAQCNVNMYGKLYPSTENAYQACKTIVIDERIPFEAMTAAQSKAAGRKLTVRTDWEEIKLDLMYQLNKQKYSQQPYKRLLLATGDQDIIEGNYWGDTFWGVCKGEGENNLGKIIMRIREELK